MYLHWRLASFSNWRCLSVTSQTRSLSKKKKKYLCPTAPRSSAQKNSAPGRLFQIWPHGGRIVVVDLNDAGMVSNARLREGVINGDRALIFQASHSGQRMRPQRGMYAFPNQENMVSCNPVLVPAKLTSTLENKHSRRPFGGCLNVTFGSS